MDNSMKKSLGSSIENSQQRQSLYLSKYASLIIEEDMRLMLFNENDKRSGKNGNLSGFINKIFQNNFKLQKLSLKIRQRNKYKEELRRVIDEGLNSVENEIGECSSKNPQMKIYELFSKRLPGKLSSGVLDFLPKNNDKKYNNLSSELKRRFLDEIVNNREKIIDGKVNDYNQGKKAVLEKETVRKESEQIPRKISAVIKDILNNDDFTDKTIDLLLKETNEKYKNRDINSFRVNNESMSILRGLDETTDEYKTYKTNCNYFSSIFEEYSRLPYFEREKIFIYDKYKEIEDAIKEKLAVRLTGYSHSDNYDSKWENWVIPCMIVPDNFYTHWYLVCVKTSRINKQCISKSKPSSFRITNIEIGVKKRYDEIGIELPDSEMDKLLIELAKRDDTQFLSGDEEKIVVDLTKEGKRLYGNLQYLRPRYQRKDDNKKYVVGKKTFECRYTFECTQFQAYVYFFKFGAEANIISPKELRVKLCGCYKDAYDLYNADENNGMG